MLRYFLMKIILQPPADRPNFWEGFTIEPEDNGLGDKDGGYLLKKGDKEWSLLRNRPNPSMLFPVGEPLSKTLKLKGFGWFKETVNGDTVTITPSH